MNEHKEMIQKAKAERKIAKYSSEYDMSIVIKAVFSTFGGLMLILGILEGICILYLRKEPGVYLVPGLVLALFAYIAGWASAIVTYFFMKKSQEKQNEQNKTQNVSGGNQ